MIGAIRRIVEKLRQFPLAERGAAAVEFALILPIMLVLYIGANEATALISMDRRVQMVAGTLGDLVARSDTTITADTMRDYFAAATSIMTPYPTDNLRQYVTQVYVHPTKGPIISWSKQYVNGVYGNNTLTSRAKDKAYPLSAQMKAVATSGSYVIVSEATTSYLPLYGLVIKNAIPLYRENYFMPRFGGSITVP